MLQFADTLDTTAAAAATSAARDLTTVANVKAAMKITNAASDALIAQLITRVTRLIVEDCRLAVDSVGSVPTFATETLTATWLPVPVSFRNFELFLPWRLPVSSIDSVTEDGNALTVGTDYVKLGARGGRLRRLSSGYPFWWNSNQIVVQFKAGFSPSTTLAVNIDPAIEAAAIEQVKSMLFASDRDPNIRSENVQDVAAVTYSVTGGDAMGSRMLLPTVRDMLAPWRSPMP